MPMPIQISKMHNGDIALAYTFEIESVKLYLDAGININHQNHDGNTLLYNIITHYSVNELKPFIKDLLDYGADPYLKNRQGLTAFDVANNDIKSLIENYLSIDIKTPDDE